MSNGLAQHRTPGACGLGIGSGEGELYLATANTRGTCGVLRAGRSSRGEDVVAANLGTDGWWRSSDRLACFVTSARLALIASAARPSAARMTVARLSTLDRAARFGKARRAARRSGLSFKAWSIGDGLAVGAELSDEIGEAVGMVGDFIRHELPRSGHVEYAIRQDPLAHIGPLIGEDDTGRRYSPQRQRRNDRCPMPRGSISESQRSIRR